MTPLLELLEERGNDTSGLRSKSWSEFEGPKDEQRRLSARTYMELCRRIELFTCLPIESLDRLALTARLEEIAMTAAPAGDD